jgi:hypothetical protein
VFVPKPGRDSYGGPKDYRPTSLKSSLLRTVERLMDIHLKDKILVIYAIVSQPTCI